MKRSHPSYLKLTHLALVFLIAEFIITLAMTKAAKNYILSQFRLNNAIISTPALILVPLIVVALDWQVYRYHKYPEFGFSGFSGWH